MTFTSGMLKLNPLPVSVTSVPKVPFGGVIEVREGEVDEENVKEHFLLEQLDGILFTVTVT